MALRGEGGGAAGSLCYVYVVFEFQLVFPLVLERALFLPALLSAGVVGPVLLHRHALARIPYLGVITK